MEQRRGRRRRGGGSQGRTLRQDWTQALTSPPPRSPGSLIDARQERWVGLASGSMRSRRARTRAAHQRPHPVPRGSETAPEVAQSHSARTPVLAEDAVDTEHHGRFSARHRDGCARLPGAVAGRLRSMARPRPSGSVSAASRPAPALSVSRGGGPTPTIFPGQLGPLPDSEGSDREVMLPTPRRCSQAFPGGAPRAPMGTETGESAPGRLSTR